MFIPGFPVVLYWEWFSCPLPRYIQQCSKSFLFVATGQGLLLEPSESGARDAAKHSTVLRTAPYNKGKCQYYQDWKTLYWPDTHHGGIFLVQSDPDFLWRRKDFWGLKSLSPWILLCRTSMETPSVLHLNKWEN